MEVHEDDIKDNCVMCGSIIDLDDSKKVARFKRRGNYCQKCNWKCGKSGKKLLQEEKKPGEIWQKIHDTLHLTIVDVVPENHEEEMYPLQ